VLVPIAKQQIGGWEAGIEPGHPAEGKQAGQPDQQRRRRTGEALHGAMHGSGIQRRHQQGQHQRVDPQVGQVPQVVPGDAQLPPGEAVLWPGRHLPVAQQEGAEAGLDTPIGHCLAVRLDRHHHGHAEQQRQQQPPRAQYGKARDARLGPHQGDGDTGEQEQQLPPPAVDQQHRPLQPFGGMHALEVKAPVVHVGHGGVIQDEQGEGEHAQGVDIVAAWHGRDRERKGASTVRMGIALGHAKGV